MSILANVKNLLKPDPEVDFQLGLREETLAGNHSKAAWLYQKAVDRGHEKAKYFLAQMYLAGRGVTEDRNRAVDLLQESADAGFEKAHKLLSDIQAGKRSPDHDNIVHREVMSGSSPRPARDNTNAPRESKAGGTLATAIGAALIFTLWWIIWRPLGALFAVTLIGGYGRRLFTWNAYFYPRRNAMVLGILWGSLMGLFSATLAWSSGLENLYARIGFYSWCFLATTYVGYGLSTVPVWDRDGAWENLSWIKFLAAISFIFSLSSITAAC